MFLNRKRAKATMLASIPLLALPLLADAGMSGDRSHRDDSQGSFSRSAFSQEDVVQGEIARKEGEKITLRTSDGERITFKINDKTRQFCPEEGMTSQTSSKGQRTGMRSDSSTSGSGMSSSGMSSSSMSGMSEYLGIREDRLESESGLFIFRNGSRCGAWKLRTNRQLPRFLGNSAGTTKGRDHVRGLSV